MTAWIMITNTIVLTCNLKKTFYIRNPWFMFLIICSANLIKDSIGIVKYVPRQTRPVTDRSLRRQTFPNLCEMSYTNYAKPVYLAC